MIYTSLDDFHLTEEQLEASPSRRDGVSSQIEAQLRRYACDGIAQAVVLMQLPQPVACTAQVLLHRFYCKRSLAHTDVKVAAIAAFWLACKLEEVIEIDSPTKLRLRDVLMTFYRIFRRRDGKSLDLLDPFSRVYDDLKAEVVRGERHMLHAFGFIVHVEHPHRFVLTFGQLLGLDRSVLQEGWNLANDSLKSTLCVRFHAEAVACGVLFLASRRLKVPMPENPPWWEAFKVSEGSVTAVVCGLLELHALPQAEYLVLCRDWTAKGLEGKSTTGNNVQNGISAAAPAVEALPQGPAKRDSKVNGSSDQIVSLEKEDGGSGTVDRHRAPGSKPDLDANGAFKKDRRRSEDRDRHDDRKRRRSRSRSRSRRRRRSPSRDGGRYDRGRRWHDSTDVPRSRARDGRR